MQSYLAAICATLAVSLNQGNPPAPNWPALDEETFQRVCRVHGLAPLLFHRHHGLDPNQQPWLAAQYHFNAQRIAKMQHELAQILALFHAQQLPVMPLKGAILSAQFYAEAACRPMADLDLLIRPADFETVTHLLKQLGYEANLAHWKHTEFSKPDNRHVVDFECEHPDNPRKLEIHMHCRESFGGPTLDLTDLMWQNSYQGTLLEQPATLPTLEALWLHLLVHCTYHFWQGRGRLIQLFDLALLTPQLSDPTAMLTAVEARYTYPALAMLLKYFPNVVDETLITQQAQSLSLSFQKWVAALDLVNSSQLNPNPSGLYLSKALNFTEGRPREVVHALRFALLPRVDELALDHPRLANSKAPWLAYFLLPLDWLKRVTR